MNFRPEIYVIPNTEAAANEVLQGLWTKIGSRTTNLGGVGIEDRAGEFRLTISERHRMGDEEHFAQAMPARVKPEYAC